MILKSLKVQEKSFQAFLCLLECSRVGKRTKVCKLEPPGTLIKSAYLSPMVPRGCSPLDRYSCSSGKLGNASSSFSCPSILIPPSDWFFPWYHIWEYGARETGDFLLVNSTHLERHYGGDRIKHSHTPPTIREKPWNIGLFKALNA